MHSKKWRKHEQLDLDQRVSFLGEAEWRRDVLPASLLRCGNERTLRFRDKQNVWEKFLRIFCSNLSSFFFKCTWDSRKLSVFDCYWKHFNTLDSVSTNSHPWAHGRLHENNATMLSWTTPGGSFESWHVIHDIQVHMLPSYKISPSLLLLSYSSFTWGHKEKAIITQPIHFLLLHQHTHSSPSQLHSLQKGGNLFEFFIRSIMYLCFFPSIYIYLRVFFLAWISRFDEKEWRKCYQEIIKTVNKQRAEKVVFTDAFKSISLRQLPEPIREASE